MLHSGGSRLALALITAAVTGQGLPFVERQMFGQNLQFFPDATMPAIDKEKREIRRMLRKDRRNSKHKINKARRGW